MQKWVRNGCLLYTSKDEEGEHRQGGSASASSTHRRVCNRELYSSRQVDFSFCCRYPEKWKSVSTSDKLEPLPGDLPPSLSWQQGDGHDREAQRGWCLSHTEWKKSPGYTVRSLGARPGFPSHLQAQEPFLTTVLHLSSFHT